MHAAFLIALHVTLHCLRDAFLIPLHMCLILSLHCLHVAFLGALHYIALLCIALHACYFSHSIACVFALIIALLLFWLHCITLHGMLLFSLHCSVLVSTGVLFTIRK